MIRAFLPFFFLLPGFDFLFFIMSAFCVCRKWDEIASFGDHFECTQMNFPADEILFGCNFDCLWKENWWRKSILVVPAQHHSPTAIIIHGWCYSVHRSTATSILVFIFHPSTWHKSLALSLSLTREGKKIYSVHSLIIRAFRSPNYWKFKPLGFTSAWGEVGNFLSLYTSVCLLLHVMEEKRKRGMWDCGEFI